MIGWLKGILLEKEPPYILLETNGVGYEIQLPLSNFTSLPEVGRECTLYIHQTSREDGEFLYGFINKDQRSLFRSLIKVNGVGPKIALAILSTMEPAIFSRMGFNPKQMVDYKSLRGDLSDNIPGVFGIGEKTAKRLIIEMRDKINQWENLNLSSPRTNSAINDAISALISLGYKQLEAKKVLDNFKDQGLSSEELIRLALKNIS